LVPDQHQQNPLVTNPTNDRGDLKVGKIQISEAKRRELIEHDVTLNGERATVKGVYLDFPRVVQIKSGMGVEFSWPTVQHVIENCDGKFTS
jgi:hypothetical protein